MNKPTFVLITALWKRPELTNLVLERFKNLKIEISDKFNLELIAVGSEGSESKKLSESKGFLYIEYKNSPLNIKFNQACIAAKQFDPFAVFKIDSDDWITSNIFEKYFELLQEGEDAIGLKDLYFLDLKGFRLGKWDGYGYFNTRMNRFESWRRKLKGRSHGVGRCFSNSAMQKLNWKLWDDNIEIDSWLDGNCDRRLRNHNMKIKSYKMSDLQVFAMDIKGGGANITIDTFKKLKIKMQNNPIDIISNYFPPEEVKNLLRLQY